MKKSVSSVKSLWKNKKVRYAALGVVALCVAAAATYTALKPKRVEAVTVAMAPVVESFYEDGLVKAKTRRVISADIPGKVLAVYGEEGRRVQEGEILLTLDTTELQAERALLHADRNAALATWEQNKEQVQQQIASLEAQRAGYAAANTSELYGMQIGLLEQSMDPSVPNSVAWSFEQMIWAAERSANVAGATAAQTQETTRLSQLDAAKAQSLSVKNQTAQYEKQLESQLVELAAKRDDTNTSAAEAAEYQSIIDGLQPAVNPVLLSYAQMQKEADAQVARLSNGEYGESTYEAQAAAKTELTGLKEQYNQFMYNTQAQILTLVAQQEQEAAARKSASGARSKLNEQIGLLEETLEEKSGTASFYQAQVELAEARIADLDRRMALAEVRAPIGGIVGALPVQEGAYVAAGTVLTEVVDTAILEIECMILAEDTVGVVQGAKAEIIWERRDGDVTFPATVKEVSSLAVESVSAIGLVEKRVKVVLTPEFGGEATYHGDVSHGDVSPGDVSPGDGFQVRVRFLVAEESALSIPPAAVVEAEQGDAVFLIVDGKAVLTPVAVGLESGDVTAVLSGIKEGDVVIADPTAAGVKEGDKVQGE